jgi:hypothetical protein
LVSDRLTMGSTETACVILPPFSHRPTPPSSLVKEHQPTAKAPQDTPTTAHVSDVDVGSHLAERLVVAIEKLISAKAAPNTASEEKKPPAKEGNLQTARASKLEYKHVDEVYAPMPPCCIMTDSIAESADSGSNKLDQYVFIVRDRIGESPIYQVSETANRIADKNTLDTASFVDIKSALLRDILREICKDIRNVSLADVTPSV